MKRLLIVLALALWPGVVGAAPAEVTPRTSAAYIAMLWCLPPNSFPASNIEAPGPDEFLRVTVDGLEFALMWQPAPEPLNFTNVPHHRDTRLRIGFPHQFEKYRGQDMLTEQDENEVHVFTLMAVGCFSMSDVTDAVSS